MAQAGGRRPPLQPGRTCIFMGEEGRGTLGLGQLRQAAPGQAKKMLFNVQINY